MAGAEQGRSAPDGDADRDGGDRVSHGPVSERRIGIEASEPVALGGRVAEEDPAARWLVTLRWVACTGMAATALVAGRIVEGLRVGPILFIVAVVAASNLVWLWVLRRPRDPSAARRWVEPQLVADVVALTAVLWFGGGVENPFSAFLVFQIALAGLVSSPRATIGVASATIVAIGVLSVASPLPAVDPWLERLAAVVSLTTLVGLLSAFVAIYAQRLEQLRRYGTQSDKLAMLGRLVGSMSHELNTPLATIKLCSTDLVRFGAEMPFDEASRLARQIHEEAERANEIIGLVRGHVMPDRTPSPVELTSFVRAFAEAELDRLQFEGERRYQMDAPFVIDVLEPALGQILVNLLRNATEASLLGRRRRITIEVVRRDGLAEVSVEDRGPGFEPEILSRLGEPFQTTKRGGMGLGLYLSGELARRIGGALVVKSVPQGGARVTLTLDAAESGPQTTRDA